jgi:hypothetical protein
MAKVRAEGQQGQGGAGGAEVEEMRQQLQQLQEKLAASEASTQELQQANSAGFHQVCVMCMCVCQARHRDVSNCLSPIVLMCPPVYDRSRRCQKTTRHS